MGKQYEVGYINAEQKDIKGKACDVIKVKLVKDGKDKWETIPSFNKCYSAAAVCNKGDIVDVTYEKKGDFFNIVGFTKVGGKESAIPSSAPSAPPAKSYGGKTEDTQLSICRQSSNTAAMNFVLGVLTNGVYPKKSTPEMLFEEVKRFAKKFEEYVTLKGDYGKVDDALETIATEEEDEDALPY